MDNENSLCSAPLLQRRNNDDRLIIIGHMLDFAQEKGLSGDALLPLLQAIENHLHWGGEYTLAAFLSRLDRKDLPVEIEDHFRRFAVSWRGRHTLYQRFRSKLKTILLRIPVLYKWAVTLRALWKVHAKHQKTTTNRAEYRDK